MKSVRCSVLLSMVFPISSLCSFQSAQIPGQVKGQAVALATEEQKEQISQGYVYIFHVVEQLQQQIDECRVSDPERSRKLRRLLGILEDMMKDRKHPTAMMRAIIDFIDSEFSQEEVQSTDAANN